MFYTIRHTNLLSIFFGLLLFAAGGCTFTRNIPEGNHLLSKNTIKCDRPELKEGISAIIKQKPNRRILGLFRFHLGVYQMANRGKETKFKKWLKSAVGEEPVIFDQNLTANSTDQILLFMQNNGYFNAQVKDSVIFKRKKAAVAYDIHSGLPYFIRNVELNTDDEAVAQIIRADSSNSLVAKGKLYSNLLLQQERERVSNLLKNHGYFQFTPLYITFRLDSAIGNHQLDVKMLISNPVKTENAEDSLNATKAGHQLSYFREIIIELDFEPLLLQDTIAKDSVFFDGFTFIKAGKVEDLYEVKHIAEHIFVKNGDLYNQDDIQLTYRRLSGLGIFRFVNIRLEPSAKETVADGRMPLKCVILLSPQMRQDYQLEGTATNSGGNFGVAGNIVYRNKNLFKGAETLNIKVKGGVEIQQNFGDTTYESTRQLAIFNAYEIGPEISLSFPRALWPFHSKSPKKVGDPSTSVAIGFNTQNRPEYFRQLVNLSYYYTQKTTRYNRFYFYPAEINYLNVELDPAFEKQLDDLADPTIRLGYTDQFIANGRFSYIFNNQDLTFNRKHFFFRFNLEFAGNSLYLTQRIAGKKASEDKPVELFNVPFAHYLRPDFDLRFYQPVRLTSSQFVFRLASGIGLTYGNSRQLPFEKSFFAGGPNEMRAWRTRQLGPGANQKDDYYERFGEMKITANVEFRFDLLRKLKGALFADAGNIWLVRRTPGRDESLFRFSDFPSQIAMGVGAGFRLDFTFFIIRIDGAIKAIDPEQISGQRWVLSENKTQDITFNFGIGYPF